MPDLLLIHPPLALPTEPPPGPAALAGALGARGLEVVQVDASIEALAWLVETTRDTASDDPRVRRLARAWDGLRDPATYTDGARHHAALHTVNTGLAATAAARGPYLLSLTDYRDRRYDAFASTDLLRATRTPDENLFDPYVRDELVPRVVAMAPRVIGLTVTYRQQALAAMAIAARLRAALPKTPVIAGGGLATAWLLGEGPTERLLDAFDAIVPGEGSAALESLVRRAERPRPDPRWLSEGGAGRPAPPRLEAHHVAHDPSFDGLDLSRYLAPAPTLPVAASRGCYWRRCAFCPEALCRDEGFVAVPANALRERLVRLSRAYGAPHVHIVDSALPPATMRGLAALPDDATKGMPTWYGFARFEPPLADLDIARGLRRAGCRMLQLGLESGSQRLLNLLGKGIELDAAARVLATLHAAGIATTVYVLAGLPTETLDDAAATRDFLVANAAHIDYLHASVMNLPIGAPLDRDPDRFHLPGGDAVEGFPGDLSVCRHLKTTGAEERRALRRFLAQDILRHPAVRPIVQRIPPFLGANHALFQAASNGAELQSARAHA